MNISKISSASFKGAYFVSGKGEDVRKVHDILKFGIIDSSNNSSDKLLLNDPYDYKKHCPKEIEGTINTIGEGYSVNEFPAYLLFTTGTRDKRAYGTFTKNQKKYYQNEVKKNPTNLSKKDFVGHLSQWVIEKCKYEGEIWMSAIKNNCRFKNKPKELDAAKVLSAIQQQKFDYINGKIYKDTIDIENITLD